MKDVTPEPFLLLEPEAAPRLEASPPITNVAEPLSRAWSPALIGAATLGLGIPALWGAWLAGALFDRWSALGWAGFIVLLIGLSLIGLGIGRELRGLAALRRVDLLRAEFASGETDRAQRAARRWWKRYHSTLQSCRLSPRLTLRKLYLRSCVRGRCKPFGKRRMCSDGLPPFRASQSWRRPLRLHWTFWRLAGALCG